MDNVNIILWIMSAGFGLNFALMIIIWNSTNARFDRIDDKFNRVDDRFNRMDDKIAELDKRLSAKIDSVDGNVKDVDRRLCRLEGAFASKDCCMIKDDRHISKAE